jgi:hypothetical protein
LTFDEIKKNLWEIVDNKRTKTRDKVQALKLLADIIVQTLELSYFGSYVKSRKTKWRSKTKRKNDFGYGKDF